MLNGFSSNLLSSLPYAGVGVPTHQISAENPTGEKGGGCKWEPDLADPNLAHSGPATDLGRGWKVRPFISVGAGQTVDLADIDGPGCINQVINAVDEQGIVQEMAQQSAVLFR